MYKVCYSSQDLLCQTYYVFGVLYNHDSYMAAFLNLQGKWYTKLRMKEHTLPNCFNVCLVFESATLNLCKHSTD